MTERADAPDSALNPHLVRRRFDRASAQYAEASALEAEVGRRMLERLSYVRLSPARILDAGAGPSREAPALAKAYPASRIVALDQSRAMLRHAGQRPGWLTRLIGTPPPQAVAARLEQMPFVPGGFELVWSNMALHWSHAPLEALHEFRRVLRPGGLLLFSTVGPDTLRELREVVGERRVHRFTDMHDLGDQLLYCGFSAPVMDVETLILTYADPAALFAELRRSGQTSARRDGPHGLTGAREAARWRAELSDRMRDGRLSVSVEVVYGHAWVDPRASIAGDPAARPVAFIRHKGA